MCIPEPWGAALARYPIRKRDYFNYSLILLGLASFLFIGKPWKRTIKIDWRKSLVGGPGVNVMVQPWSGSNVSVRYIPTNNIRFADIISQMRNLAELGLTVTAEVADDYRLGEKENGERIVKALQAPADLHILDGHFTSTNLLHWLKSNREKAGALLILDLDLDKIKPTPRARIREELHHLCDGDGNDYSNKSIFWVAGLEKMYSTRYGLGIGSKSASSARILHLDVSGGEYRKNLVPIIRAAVERIRASHGWALFPVGNMDALTLPWEDILTGLRHCVLIITLMLCGYLVRASFWPSCARNAKKGLAALGAIGTALGIAVILAGSVIRQMAWNRDVPEFLLRLDGVATREVDDSRYVSKILKAEMVSIEQILKYVRLSDARRLWTTSPEEIYRRYVLSPDLADGCPTLDWRAVLWSSLYQRVRTNSDVRIVAWNIAYALRERMTFSNRLSEARAVSDIWRSGYCNRNESQRLYLASLRAVGVPSRLVRPEGVEIFENSTWQYAPKIPYISIDEALFVER